MPFQENQNEKKDEENDKIVKMIDNNINKNMFINHIINDES